MTSCSASAGPRSEAEAIKHELGAFLRDQLKLELSETKTLITHARTQAARFLGYDIAALHDNRKRDRRGHRCINGQIGLRVPPDVVRKKCRALPAPRQTDAPLGTRARLRLQHRGPVPAEYRGVAEYYRRAYNLHRLNRLKWVMERSLTRTLALKLRTSISQVYRRFGATLQTDQGPCVGLQVTVEREEDDARW